MKAKSGGGGGAGGVTRRTFKGYLDKQPRGYDISSASGETDK